MHAQLLEPLLRRDSLVRRQSAGVKMALSLGGILGLVLASPASKWFFMTYSVFLLAIALAGRVPASHLFKRLLLLEPLVLGVAVMAWFQPNGGQVFLGILIKSTLCLVTTLLLSATTSFGEMLRVLQALRTPPLLMTTLALMYRYLFVIVGEAGRMQRARAARTFSSAKSHRWATLASVIGLLFVRASERAERIHAAMCARGWR